MNQERKKEREVVQMGIYLNPDGSTQIPGSCPILIFMLIRQDYEYGIPILFCIHCRRTYVSADQDVLESLWRQIC